MPADFKLIKSVLVDAEGTSYVNDPYDPGGGTKYGITERDFPHLDIRNLTLEEALNIYEDKYWNKYRLNEIDNQAIANLLFLAYINQDPIGVAKTVQRAINLIKLDFINSEGVEEDGVMGSITLQAINNSPKSLLTYIRLELIKRYVLFVSKKPYKIRYLMSWLHRTLI